MPITTFLPIQDSTTSEIMRAKTKTEGPRLLLLCGLPGAGKSTFAQALVNTSTPSRHNFSSISTDEDGKGWLAKLAKEFKRAAGA